MLAVLAGATFACGLEDPSSISLRRGVLNLAFPESLHVGTAVWQAQLAGKLPRDAFAHGDDLAPEARATLRMVRVNALLGRLAARLGEARHTKPRPNLAVVLLGPVMWNRFVPAGGVVGVEIHVQGPAAGDVVVVTDIAVIEAIAAGDIGFAEAIELGVVRLYGPPADVTAARTWLAELARA